jgi:putative transposase
MPRLARLVVPGLLHHITQRGNNRGTVFFAEQDYLAYLAFLKEEAQRFRLRVASYCLMPNHIHLVAIPETEPALALAVGRTHWRYAQHSNRVHGRSGHLWQNRFSSCPLDARHGWLALRYVEHNPVRAGLAQRAWEYRWSSAAAHVGEPDASGALDMELWRDYGGAAEWREALRGPEDDRTLGLLRERTMTGWALAGGKFLAALEQQLGRKVQPLAVGRPRKAREGAEK